MCKDIAHENFAKVACEAVELMQPLLDAHGPKVDILFRSSYSENEGWYHFLCLQTYLMQEYVPGGVENPVYQAAICERFSDFERGIEAYKANMMLCGA